MNRAAATPLGRLYLVPAPMDDVGVAPGPLDRSLPEETLQCAARLEHWICENAKSLRAYLKRVAQHHALARPLQSLHISELPHAAHKKGDHVGAARFDAGALLQAALQGHDMGLASEAGMPAVADPGSSVVRAAHDLGLRVQPLVGPSALLLALAASGLGGQDFAFVGYLPQDPVARTRRIHELERLALSQGQTQLFIETPYRNMALLQALLHTLSPNVRLAVSVGLTWTEQAHCHSNSVKAWRQASVALPSDVPAVFAIGR